MDGNTEAIKQSAALEPQIAAELVRRPMTLDDRIRAAGYSIHSRPAIGQAAWIKNGVCFPQSEVVKRLANGPAA